MNQTVRNIEIGIVNDKPAFTLHLDNDTTQTIIFSLEIARKLSWGLISLCERLTPPEKLPGDNMSVNDGCSIGIQPPKED